MPQVHGAVSVSQDEPVRSNSKKKYKGKFREPVHHVGGVEGLYQPLLTEPFEARHHIEVCRVHQQLNLVGSELLHSVADLSWIKESGVKI